MDCDGVRRSSVNWRGCMVTYFAFNDFICCIRGQSFFTGYTRPEHIFGIWQIFSDPLNFCSQISDPLFFCGKISDPLRLFQTPYFFGGKFQTP
jgi:hypothetical protein